MLAPAQSFYNGPSHSVGPGFLLPQSVVHYFQGQRIVLIWYVLL